MQDFTLIVEIKNYIPAWRAAGTSLALNILIRSNGNWIHSKQSKRWKRIFQMRYRHLSYRQAIWHLVSAACWLPPSLQKDFIDQKSSQDLNASSSLSLQSWCLTKFQCNHFQQFSTRSADKFINRCNAGGIYETKEGLLKKKKKNHIIRLLVYSSTVNAIKLLDRR